MVDPSPIWGLIEFGILVLCCLFSIPIAFSLGVTGLIFGVLFYGVLGGVSLAGLTFWGQSYKYALSLIPLFVFMGEIISACDLGKEAFDAVKKWVGNIKGGLAIASTISCALFGTITGSTAGTIAAIGGVCLPEMKRYGYNVRLRTGAIAMSGTLAALIPPSIMMVFYAVLTDVSIGKLFIGGIVPGVILTIFYSLTVYVWVWLNPRIAPVITEKVTFKQKMSSLKLLVPICIIFVSMVGGLYTGFFSATEAAGMGAVIAIVTVIVLRRLTWKRLSHATQGTMRITAFIMLLVMGAILFASTIAITRLPYALAEIVVNLQAPPLVIVFIVIAITIVLGCVLDVFGLMVLTVPMFFPCLMKLGFDPVWYGVLTTVLVELALVTPPIAAHLYITQSIDSEATSMDVARGVIPFYVAELVMIVLMVFFPQIVLWLPSKM
jgi:tripartite ATP-independent transporter DctM subunit